MSKGREREETTPLLAHSSAISHTKLIEESDQEQSLVQNIRIESKNLWRIVGPGALTRLASYSILIVSQSFAGHLGDLELAALSIAINVVLGFDFGLLLGMASALETLCGQAFGAKKYYLLGVYLQRSWVVLSLVCLFMLPLFIFATPILKLAGQPAELAELTGVVVLCFIPIHFSYAFQFPQQRFLQSQLKNTILTWINFTALAVHTLLSWLVVYRLRLGVVAAALTLSFSWWLIVLLQFLYTVCGGCPETWVGFSGEAFSGLWEFFKLSVSSGVMLCLENWYYRILLLMTGNMKNAEIAVDALSVCMNINGWEMSIPLAFFAGTGVRVANELGAGNGRGAKFAAIVSVCESVVIGMFFAVIIMLLGDNLALLFTSSKPVVEAFNQLSLLLAFTILLNSVQPILSGVAVGCGWQAYVAYVNLGCYYVLGLPLGILMGLVFHQGIWGIWAGMIFGGTAVQTLILAIMTVQCDWEKEAEKAKEIC